MTARSDHGMTTAEYAVGTVGACTIGLAIHHLATDGVWIEQIIEVIRRALAWRTLLDGVPPGGIRF